MRKGNLNYLKAIFPYFMVVTWQRGVPILDNYDAPIAEFLAVLDRDDPAEQRAFRAGLRNTLIILLNHPEDFELNDWYCRSSGHYMESDEQVHELLARIWDQFFPDDRWDVPAYKDEPYTMSDEDVY